MGPNAKVVELLRAFVTARGGVVPVPSGTTWNAYVLDLLAAAITASGGSPIARGAQSWNDDLISLLTQLSTLGGTAAFQQFNKLTGGTFTNTGSVAAGTPTEVGNYLQFVTQTTTASPLPNQWAVMSWPIKNLAGATADVDLLDITRALIRSNLNTPPTDLVVGTVVHAGSAGAGTAPSATTKGIGVIMGYNVTGWQVGHTIGNGTAWTNTFGTASASTVGGILIAGVASSTQYRIYGIGTDSSDNLVTGTGSTNALAAAGDNLDTISVGIGFLSGTGGSAAVNVPIRADLFAAKNSNLSLAAR